MHGFEVWAPAAKQVDLVIDGARHSMRRDPTGHHRLSVESASAGTRYAFSVDGAEPRPDPRSAYQPEGVFGPSEVVDHAAFRWSDQTFRGVSLPGSVLYELHVGTFTPEGTFDAAIHKLPHLLALGVDAVELLPIAEFSGKRGWGYDGVDLYAPHHAYGGPEGLKRLVDACHGVGLGVVIDVVYNHLGPVGNFLSLYGPYFSERHHTNWGRAINFDGPGSDEVRRYFIDNALMWLSDYHCDGLRLDAVHAIVDDSAKHVLCQLAEEVRALRAHVRKPLFLIAESDRNDPRYVLAREAGGFGLDAAWADEWHHAMHARLTGETKGYYEDFGGSAELKKALEQAWVYDGTYSEHRKRVHGASPRDLRGDQFVVSVQNHDQVGNRAVGDRLSALTSRGRLKAAAALMLTGPFTPMLFQGEEWAAGTPFLFFSDHEDPEVARNVTEGRPREFSYFGWDPEQIPDPQAEQTFLDSRLDWRELEGPEGAEMFAFYQRLIQLRRRHAALTDPRLAHTSVVVDETEELLTVARGPVRVVVNLSGREVRVDHGPRATLLLSSSAVRSAGAPWRVPADAVLILLIEHEA